MGLENSIVVIPKNEYGKAYLERKWHDEYNKDFHYYELAYLRKYFSIRNNIIDALELPDEGGEYSLVTKDISDIIEILEENLDRRIYEQNTSIWHYHQGIVQLSKNIYRLTEFLVDIKNGEILEDDVEIKFYDSY